MPAFVVSNAAAENCVLKPLGENIFAAFKYDFFVIFLLYVMVLI